ncbi:MAG: hypothetical protein V3V22_10780 [Methylococcales bacterium]
MKPIKINQFEQPVPLWVKPIMMLYAVLACLAIFLIGCSPVDLPADTATTEPVAMDVDQPLPVDTLITEVSDPLADIRPQLQTLTQQQATLQTEQAELSTAAEQQQVQISALQDSVTQLAVQLQDHHLQLQQRLRSKKPNTVRRTQPRKKTPTLSLASIDQWGDDYTAVLYHQQQLVTLRQGDRYQDWQLTEIDPAQQQIELINVHKQHLTLTLY